MFSQLAGTFYLLRIHQFALIFCIRLFRDCYSNAIFFHLVSMKLILCQNNDTQCDLQTTMSRKSLHGTSH